MTIEAVPGYTRATGGCAHSVYSWHLERMQGNQAPLPAGPPFRSEAFDCPDVSMIDTETV
ncbi:hypothetical protein DSECCO2_51530 [anaerobic digester metagenome]|jgi:hypothetical protein